MTSKREISSTITSVKEDHVDIDKSRFGGYVIETTEKPIKVLVDEFGSLCCEDYDVFLAFEDKIHGRMPWMGNVQAVELDTLGLVGAKISSVSYVSDALNETVENSIGTSTYVSSALVNIETDRGIVQLVAWNEHNGYYPHTVHVEWDDFKDEQEI